MEKSSNFEAVGGVSHLCSPFPGEGGKWEMENVNRTEYEKDFWMDDFRDACGRMPDKLRT